MNRDKDENTRRKLERVVLIVYSFYSAGMFVAALMAGWNLIAREIIVGALIVSWAAYLKNYKSHDFRAKLIAVMAWTNFTVYALYSTSFSSVLSNILCLTVLLGLFCQPRIIYMGVVFSTLIFLYQGFVAKNIVFHSANDVIRLSLQILAVYVVSAIMWIMIRAQKETNEKLIENIHELELAEQSKDDFMVNISHEIRTPINAVCGMSEAILQEELPAEVRKDVIDIQTAGRNLLSTVSNILDFSELESGKMTLAEESYNITSTITDIINMALTLENGRRLEFIVDCDASLPSSLLGDEQKFRRIVMNLLDNAYKFTKEGGIVLRIAGRKEDYGINLMVSVKDSGIGMDRVDMEKIFTSFSQVDSKRNREEGGVGLGLAITQALVHSMGGFITVKSAPKTGSEFRFTIPQKVLDETPIISIRDKKDINVAGYLNTDKYDYSVVREGYESCIRHTMEQFGIAIRFCKNLPALKRRIESEKITHVFIGWDEYCEDRNYFEQLAGELTVILILEYGQETHAGSNMLRIYKPFTALSIAAVFNGQKAVQNDGQHVGPKYRFTAPGAKVLVVDDNVMNLKVMARLLLPYQIKVTMAGGGLEALEKLDSMDFDCVFLDHMMPEMDGVETLQKIRKKAGAYFQSLPVIAFTANAIGGAREMFIREGFDDFIAKPIELSVLERMLRRYIPTQKQIVAEDEDAPAAQAGGGDALHSAGKALDSSAGSSMGRASGGSAESPVGRASGGSAESSAGRGSGGSAESSAGRASGGSAESPAGRASDGSAESPVSRASGGSAEFSAGRASGGSAESFMGRASGPAAGPGEAASAVSSRENTSQALAALEQAGIDLKQGMEYCGDMDGFREITAIYHSEGAKRKAKLQQFFGERDWKNYVIMVHSLKSNSKGIGANELSGLALNLEMAGKEGRIDYIYEHHEEMMEKHDALLRVLAANPLIYPDGFGEGAGSAESPDLEPSENGEAQGTRQEIDRQALAEQVALLREKLESFESEGVEEILDRLAGCRYHAAGGAAIHGAVADETAAGGAAIGETATDGIGMDAEHYTHTFSRELAGQIKDRVDEFDFPGAADILDLWEKNNLIE